MLYGTQRRPRPRALRRPRAEGLCERFEDAVEGLRAAQAAPAADDDRSFLEPDLGAASSTWLSIFTT